MSEPNTSGTTAALLALRGPQLWRIDVDLEGAPSARAERIGPAEWRGVAALAGRRGLGYAIEKGSLFGIYGDNGQYQRLGTAGDWRRAGTLAATDDAVFAVDGDRLYRVDPRSGRYGAIGKPGDWTGEVRLAAVGARLAALWRDHLYEVDPVSGAWRPLDELSELTDVTALAGLDDAVFVVFRGGLWRVALDDGARRRLGARDWSGPALLASAGGALFGMTDEDLFLLDPETGDERRLSERREWAGTTHLAGM